MSPSQRGNCSGLIRHTTSASLALRSRDACIGQGLHRHSPLCCKGIRLCVHLHGVLQAVLLHALAVLPPLVRVQVIVEESPHVLQISRHSPGRVGNPADHHAQVEGVCAPPTFCKALNSSLSMSLASLKSMMHYILMCHSHRGFGRRTARMAYRSGSKSKMSPWPSPRNSLYSSVVTFV